MNRRHTRESILNLGNNFMSSRVLISGAELDLFSRLAEKPLSIDEIITIKKPTGGDCVFCWMPSWPSGFWSKQKANTGLNL